MQEKSAQQIHRRHNRARQIQPSKIKVDQSLGGAMKAKVHLQEAPIKKGSWSPDEDAKLVDIVGMYGHGRWNYLAKAAGLQRTGKSCRLRWLNYLRPNVRHGGFSLDEQLLILQLHFRWGNRWAKIAEQLPGRTDNDIKNYWRTRILKHAKHLNCDVTSPMFKHTIRDVWIPTLLERITSGSGSGSGSGSESEVGQAHPPADSPQDVSGPDPNDTVLVELPAIGPEGSPCTEKPKDESGPVGSWEPTGFKQAQNSPDCMGNGPCFDPLVFVSNPSPWSACELELDFDFDLDAHDYARPISYGGGNMFD